MATKPCYSCIGHVLCTDLGGSSSDHAEKSKIQLQVLRSFFKDIAFRILEDFNCKLLLFEESVNLDQLMERFDLFFEKVSIGAVSFVSFMELMVRKPKDESDRPELKVNKTI